MLSRRPRCGWAADRARESARPDRLFDDPWADTLAGPEGREILADLADVSGPVPEGTPHLSTWFAKLADKGIRRRFATDDPEGLFASHGWQAQVLQYGEEGADYGRWPWPTISRDDTNWPHNYLVSAGLSGR